MRLKHSVLPKSVELGRYFAGYKNYDAVGKMRVSEAIGDRGMAPEMMESKLIYISVRKSI